MTYILGLTGSIGMGKSTTAEFFRNYGVPVWDADAAVHALYAKGGAGPRALKSLVPDAVSGGSVDRDALRKAVLADPALLKQVEATIHPLVSADRTRFLNEHKDDSLVVCDIPLLFETGADRWLDGILVVTADLDTQRQRVLERPGMSAPVFDAILAKQMPDVDKRSRADFVIDTSQGMAHAKAEVMNLVARLTGENDA